MTCIVAIAENGKVYMGGDSLVSSGGYKRIKREKKVYKVGDFIIGHSGGIRGSNLLKFSLEVPKNNKKDDFEYMVAVVVPAIRELFKDGGYTSIDNNVEGTDSYLLIGYRGVIYNFYGDFQIDVYLEKFTAMGSGKSYALGALEVLEDKKMSPERKVMRALQVAGKYNSFVGAPYYVEEL